MLLYVGPDALLPLASILGAIGGAIMIFWRQVVNISRRIAGVFRPAASAAKPPQAPDSGSA